MNDDEIAAWRKFMTPVRLEVLRRVHRATFPKPGTNPGTVFWVRDRAVLDAMEERSLVKKSRRGGSGPKHKAVILPLGTSVLALFDDDAQSAAPHVELAYPQAYFRDTRIADRKVRIAVLACTIEEAARLLHAGKIAPKLTDDPAAREAVSSDPGRVFWRLREINCDMTWHPSTKPPAEAPLPPHEQKQRDFQEQREAERKREAAASVFHVYAGGMPGHIDADAEANVSIVHLTSRRGATISIEWSEAHGGFAIHTIRAERESPDDERHLDAAAHVRPMTSNVVLVIPTPHDRKEDERRSAARDAFASREIDSEEMPS